MFHKTLFDFPPGVSVLVEAVAPTMFITGDKCVNVECQTVLLTNCTVLKKLMTRFVKKLEKNKKYPV